jgi:zinc protease
MTASDISGFYRLWYHPNNATLIVSGDIDPPALLARIQNLFSAIPSAPLPPRPTISLQPLGSTTVSDSIELPISVSALLYRTPGTADADYPPSVIFNQLLNSGRGEFAELAASGKMLAAINVASALPEVGTSFVVGIPAANDSPKAAAGLLAGVLASYRSDGVPPELIAATKLRFLNERAYEQASISGLAFEWAQAIGQRQGTPSRVYDAVASVTNDDVNRVVRTYYTPEHQITALLSPKPFAAIPSVDQKAGAENVRYVPLKQEPLPAWAVSALSAPLKVPEVRSGDVTMHLANGLTVVIRSETVSPTVVVKGEVKTDSQLYEPRGMEGVATLTSELMPWGTTAYDRKGYQTQLDAIAANVSLGSEFSLDAASKDFDRALQLLADGMLHPAFPQAGFNVLKAQAIALTAAGEKLPATQASIAETKALYPPGDPRRRRTTAKSLQSVGLGDVQRWYAFAYRPDLTTIAIVGNVTPAEARAAVSKYFGGW